ncbi:MAG TPA: hypothetical protein VFE37_07960 [Chloroflexota bacterium]|nr:hypothetical protein [Chloroflexota bacterium]
MAERRRQPTDAELERALVGLGEHLAYPPTPEVVGAVRRRLLAEPDHRPAWASLFAWRWGLAPALLALALLAVVALALGANRDAIAGRLGLRGLTITYLPAVPTVVGGPVGPTLGERVSLDEAQARVPWPILLPTLPELGAPDEVYLGEPQPGGQVVLLYRPRAGPDVPPGEGIGLLLTEFRGDLLPPPGTYGKGLAPDSGKGLGPGTQLEELSVNGGRGYWIEGWQHLYFYRDPAGQVRQGTTRLVGNVLLWEQGDLTLRLEAGISRAEALRIAASVR